MTKILTDNDINLPLDCHKWNRLKSSNQDKRKDFGGIPLIKNRLL